MPANPAVSPAERTIAFVERLRVPTGKLAGEPFKLAAFQRRYIEQGYAPGIDIAVLSVGRGNGKTALGGALALAALMGANDGQPKREILIAARNREQARLGYSVVCGLIETLPPEQRERFVILQPPRLEIRYQAEGGPHYLKCLASDGRSALGTSPTFVLMDERAHWQDGRGDLLEGSLLTGLAKRSGRCVMISTSAPDDNHAFSRWLDSEQAGVYAQEHRPPADLPADDLESLAIANPGAAAGIGASLEDLRKAAERATKRGGSALQQFRLFNRNERVSDLTRAVLLTVDEWAACEVDELPPRVGPCIIGVDSGESASMSAAAFFWPQSGRLESHGWFPSDPGLLDRGQTDRVGSRYVEMAERGELSLIGQKTVPVREWIKAVMAKVQGCAVSALVSDKFKESQITEGLQQAGVTVPVTWRRFGWYDGGEDVERFRAACLDREIKVLPSLLMRSAIADCVVQRDDCGNSRLAKGRSLGRIDAIAAAVIAVAEGKRRAAIPIARAPRVAWA